MGNSVYPSPFPSSTWNAGCSLSGSETPRLGWTGSMWTTWWRRTCWRPTVSPRAGTASRWVAGPSETIGRFVGWAGVCIARWNIHHWIHVHIESPSCLCVPLQSGQVYFINDGVSVNVFEWLTPLVSLDRSSAVRCFPLLRILQRCTMVKTTTVLKAQGGLEKKFLINVMYQCLTNVLCIHSFFKSTL